MFRPVKVSGRWLVDGGVRDRLGLHALRPDERTLIHCLTERPRGRGSKTVRLHVRKAGPSRRLLLSEGLPRVTPFHLDRGPVALQRTREAASRWLESPAQH